MEFDSLDDLLNAYYGNLYPRYNIYQLTPDRWIAVVFDNPILGEIIGTNYKTELEAEFAAQRYIRTQLENDHE